MSWHDFERMHGEHVQARDTLLDVDEDPADVALAQLDRATAILDPDRGLSVGQQLARRVKHGGHQARHSAPGRAKRWRRDPPT